MKIKKIVTSLVLSGMMVTSLPYNAFASEKVEEGVNTPSYIALGNLAQPVYDLVNVPSLLSKGHTGKGVKIAILDTGISNHSDLNVVGGVSTVDYTTSYQDDHGHGTHVAGIIGAKDNNTGITGIAPNAELYAVKVMNQNSEAFNADVIEGIQWAIDNDMDIINMSIGLNRENVEMKELLDEAYNKGILIVASAGNYGNASATDNSVMYPAKYDSVIAVGAVDQTKSRWTKSSTGSAVEVVAPGVDVISTYVNNQFAKTSGTSQAAPFVSGLLALYKEAYPEKSNVEIRSMLQENTEDLGVTGRDSEYGFGLVKIPVLPNDEEEEKPVEPTKPPNEGSDKTNKEPSSFTLEFNQNHYNLKDMLQISGIATDENGNPIEKANIRLNIRGGGKLYLYNVTTNATGEYNFILPLNPLRFSKGEYAVVATILHEGYENTSQTGTFKISEPQPEITIIPENEQVQLGDYLKATAAIVDEEGNPFSGYITVILRDENGKEIRKNYYSITNGTFDYKFSTRTLNTGAFTVEISPRYIDGISASVSFNISAR